MIEILLGADLAVAEFVANGLGDDWQSYLPFTAMGICVDGRLVAGVVYNRYVGHEIHLISYSENPRWLSRKILREIFAYPYIQLGCVRTTAVTGRSNHRTRKLLVGIGYRLEGTHRKGLDGRQTALSYGMLKEECKWIA